ncbi:hypothetical protein BU24DRAFT_428383 [Aaosphaeria arxii CBS 175.79]|uniref:DNA-binding protein RAP1 n=1 Tax=Aaosphaeria arxii CBS 175.79 TaxID=1450172 RepID=A0A6A5X975_9PLEO|nr:uncharacterized protein BU24DRAFT_428383 [Aaosphaeria arxii CBS 175.79]KAF2009491.1 hypothetical protein BU24DRAFT_428383 [Aaosphaeria arxii CBS 175.79]
MAAPIVYDDVAAGANLNGTLFAGKKFWIAQRVPLRNSILDKIKSNGGEITQLEKKADYLIADHCRRDNAPGTISYTFIDASIQNGEIQDPDEHLAGPPVGTASAVSAGSKSSRTSRAAYTAEEDRILYKWVRDHEKMGGRASGNEIYIQLEAKYPRHTWHSWRDRYLKRLRDQPPAGLNVPDNAPPSPPSDQSVEQVPRNKSRAELSHESPGKKQDKTVKTSPRSNDSPKRHIDKATIKEVYTVSDLELLFTFVDWEELYANADVITAIDEASAKEAWARYAEVDDKKRTTEQWKQYFEKVVLPDYQRDDSAKKERVKKRVTRKHEQKSHQGGQRPERHQVWSQSQPQDEEVLDSDRGDAQEQHEPSKPSPSAPARGKETATKLSSAHRPVNPSIAKAMAKRRGIEQAQDAFSFYVQATKEAGAVDESDLDGGSAQRRQVLWPRWQRLSFDVQATYVALAVADLRRVEMEKSEKRNQVSEVATSSTLAPLTPTPKASDKISKRVREVEEEAASPSRPSKIHRSKRSPPKKATKTSPRGIERQPLEVSSETNSSALADDEDEDDEDEELPQLHHQAIKLENVDTGAESDQPTPLARQVRYPTLRRSSDLPNDTPTGTPRAARSRASAFDTQAILSSPPNEFSLKPIPKPIDSQDIFSSPSQGPSLMALPRPARDVTPSIKEEPTSAPGSPLAIDIGSEDSNTHSMQEFRRSLNGAQSPGYPSLNLYTPVNLSRSPAGSPSPSEFFSQESGDPDPPLDPEEMDEFFAEQHSEGFSDQDITRALKHTRCRPELAVQVLDAWKDGLPLPDVRGVWSALDDEQVVSSNPSVLAALAKKHTLDGWGGVTERNRFLAQLSGRM